MKAIIDIGTILVHAALAAQETKVVVTHKKSGRQKEFDNATQFWGHHSKRAGGWLQSTNDARIEKGLAPFSVEDFNVDSHTNLVDGFGESPEAVACGRLNNKIKSITDNDWCDDYVICLGVGENFRYAEAHTQPYKHGRSPKPLLLEYVKEYMIRKYKHKLIIVQGVEDDDIVSSILWQDWIKSGKDHSRLSTVGVYVDKDIKQIPCWHYDFDNPQNGLTKITEDQAHRYFATQLLCGDSTDSIPPLPALDESLAKEWGVRKTKGVGKKTAEAILEGQTPQGMYERVSEAYRAYYGPEKKSFTAFRGEELQWDWTDHLNERFQLLRLRRDVLHPVGHVKDFLLECGVSV